MAFHHMAIATRDLDATHRFYTEAMGFRLVKVVTAPSPEGGWAKHVFYDTGNGELIAFWDLHDHQYGEFDASISRGLGLPSWTNHIAFDAPTLDDLAAQRRRWQDHGMHVAEIDHGWCTSIYVTDPNDILVEFCTTTREFTAGDHADAARALVDPAPAFDPEPEIVFYEPTGASVTG
jgi:catechol 2,3-dioxygenase-like lactoylglutathione lyase family enzyme